MPQRREILIGTACIGAALGGFALTPRRHVSLLGGRTIASIAPTGFDGWSAETAAELSAPFDRDGLVNKLYDEVVQRVYTQAATGYRVMVMFAHGGIQSDQLQIHRPEVCYPAFGYAVSGTVQGTMPITGSVGLPVRRFVASVEDRRESVVYWSRIGETFPTSGSEQRIALLEAAIQGQIVDGLLARFSTLDADPASAMSHLDGFVRSFVRAVRPGLRTPLVGTSRGDALRRIAF